MRLVREGECERVRGVQGDAGLVRQLSGELYGVLAAVVELDGEVPADRAVEGGLFVRVQVCGDVVEEAGDVDGLRRAVGVGEGESGGVVGVGLVGEPRSLPALWLSSLLTSWLAWWTLSWLRSSLWRTWSSSVTWIDSLLRSVCPTESGVASGTDSDVDVGIGIGVGVGVNGVPRV